MIGLPNTKTMKISALLTIASLLLCIACGSEKPRQPERLPDNEIPAYREACIIMSRHTVLKDSAYRITIPKDSAAKLGVPERYYDRIVQDIEYTNYLIREEYNKKGIPVELSDWNIEPGE